MIKDPEKLREFEEERARSAPVDVEANFRIMDALYEEARALGALPSKNPLDGIELKIRIARAVNRVQRAD